jgi:hypothetical protein
MSFDLEIQDGNNLFGPGEANVLPHVEMQTAAFVLKLQAKHRLSKAAVNDLVGETGTMFRHFLSTGIDGDTMLNALAKFSTDKKRIAFFKKKCTYIEPKAVLLGEQYVTSNGKTTLCKSYGYVIPFEATLTKLLNVCEVWDNVCNTHFSTDGLMRDYCDAAYFKEHPLFRQHPSALQIVLNYDDLEIVNAMSSHVKKHKCAMFYWTLGNLKPHFRSKWANINLLGVAKTTYLKKFGLSKFLNDFVSTVTKMSTTGIDLVINDSKELIKGTLLLCICDNPASGFLGGFKESPLFARRGCRTCTASTAEMRNCFDHDAFKERNPVLHVQRCENLMRNTDKKDKAYWSKMWGINSYSPLLDIPGINLAQVMIHDGMHCLQEGILPETTALMLQFGIENKVFSLAWLNSELKRFPYTYLDRDNKPETILRKHIFDTVKLKQTAVQMITLTYVLPLVLYPKAEQLGEYYRNYCNLAAICLLCNSPYCDKNTAGDLQVLIEGYLYGFKHLYPTIQMRCKCHFLCHFPIQCLRFGATKHLNLFRFESKNNFFKQFRWKQFRNLPLSLAKHHQLFECYYALDTTGQDNDNYLYSGDIIQNGSSIMFDDVYPDMMQEIQVHVLLPLNKYLPHDIPVYTTNEVILNGLRYMARACLLIGWESNFPLFAEIESIFVFEKTKFVVVRVLHTQYFESKANAYAVKVSNLRKLILFKELRNTWPLPQYDIGGTTLITNRYAHFSGGHF